MTLDFVSVSPLGACIEYITTLGYYDDGRLGEVFLGSPKIGTDIDIATRDAAMILSFALQHGADVATMRAAMSRDATGRPEGVMGTLLDLITDGSST